MAIVTYFQWSQYFTLSITGTLHKMESLSPPAPPPPYFVTLVQAALLIFAGRAINGVFLHQLSHLSALLLALLQQPYAALVEIEGNLLYPFLAGIG